MKDILHKDVLIAFFITNIHYFNESLIGTSKWLVS